MTWEDVKMHDGWVVLASALALVAVLVLVLVVSHWFSLWMSRKDEQESCPYCHGRKMLTCDGGKVRLSYLAKSGTWKVSSEALGFIGAFRHRFCPQCGRDMSWRKGR